MKMGKEHRVPYLQTLRPASRPDPVVRLETEPGQQMQMDWIEFRKAGHKHGMLAAFVATLGYSRASYVEFVSDIRLETLLACHVRAFDAFGATVSVISFGLCERQNSRSWSTAFVPFWGLAHLSLILTNIALYFLNNSVDLSESPEFMRMSRHSYVSSRSSLSNLSKQCIQFSCNLCRFRWVITVTSHTRPLPPCFICSGDSNGHVTCHYGVVWCIADVSLMFSPLRLQPKAASRFNFATPTPSTYA